MKVLSNDSLIQACLVFVLSWCVSTPAAAIDLIHTSGKPARLHAIVESDDWTLVMLWAHDCIPCERQKPMIEKYYRETKLRGLTVVGVSTDSKVLRAKAEKTYEASKTSFRNYFFEGADFSSAYGNLTGRDFLGTPTYLVYDPNGKLRGTHTGTLNRDMLDKQFGPVLKEPEFTPSVDLLR